MTTRRRALVICLLLGSGILLHTALGLSQPPPGPYPYPPQQMPPPPVPGQNPNKVLPRLEPYAETRLLMEGLAKANFRGLERILSQKPQEEKAWVFGRGQALLLAETGNLLMLRPPRNEGEPIWFQRASDFRSAAVQLAASLGMKEYQRSRDNLFRLADTCNRCHQTFRVRVQIKPFSDSIEVSK